MSSNRSILFIGAGILSLVAVSVVVVLLVHREPASFPAGSAEAAMVDYLAAWDDNRTETAYGFLSTSVRSRVTQQEYLDAASQYRTYPGPSHEVSIDRVVGSGERVTIELTVAEFYGDGLSADVSRSPRSVPMVHEASGWKIDDALVWLEPGPLYEKVPAS